MNFKLHFKGFYSILQIKMELGKIIISEPGTMVSMKGNIEVTT